MAKMTVHLMGIMYFHVCYADPCDPKTRQILLPDGTKSGGHMQMPPHYASIFVDENRCNRIEGDWPGEIHERYVYINNRRGVPATVRMFELRIMDAPTVVTFPDGGSGNVEVVNLDEGLVRLRDLTSYFKPDLSGKGSIARVPVGGGSLQVSAFNGVNPVHWRMDSGEQPLIITATSARRKALVYINSQDGPLGAEIAFLNAPDLLSEAAHGRNVRHEFRGGHDHGDHPIGSHSDHFHLYDKINVNSSSGSVKPPLHRTTFKNGHALFKAFGNMSIASSCSGTCCDR